MFVGMDRNLWNVDFYDKVNKDLYGRTRHGENTPLCSVDGGSTWEGVTKSQYDLAKVMYWLAVAGPFH